MLFKLLNAVCSLFPIKKEIVFESNPDLACNSFEVYNKILKDEAFNNYSFIWLVNDAKKYYNGTYIRTSFINYNDKTILGRLKSYFCCNRAEIVIASCKPFCKYKGNKKQLNIYLDHGSQLKNMKTNNCKVKLSCDYIISQGHFFNKYLVDQYTISEHQILTCGIPRNDQFYHDTKSLSSIYEDYDTFDKIIAWVPTFRISSNNRIDCDFDFPLGIPILYDTKTANELNSYLVSKNILLIFKPHPAQNLNILKELSFSNIRFLHNDELLRNNIQTNEFLKCCDAMITDYSGIYYDYLCLDRPIGITLDDFSCYSKQHGFVFYDPLDILKGYYIYNIDELKSFISEVSDNCDSCKEARNRINKMVNDYDDGKSTDRLIEFIKEKRSII